LILPTALARALFPKMSSISHDIRADLSRRVVSVSTVALFPMVVAMIYFADEALSHWLGPAIGLAAAPILKVLALGYLLNASSYVPFIQIQSLERPDLSAKAHMIELPLYLGGLFLLIGRYGAIGAAWAWFIRIFIDTVAMFWLASRVPPKGVLGGAAVNTRTTSQMNRQIWQDFWGVLFGAALLFPGIFIHALQARALAAVATLIIFSGVSWRFWFDAGTRHWLIAKVRLARR
jgi:O-antigen/teichoic acid export membrane protein